MSEFQTAFDGFRCLDVVPVASRPLRLALRGWASQRVATAVSALLLREHLGYAVTFSNDLVPGVSSADMEVWPSRLGPMSDSFVDAGPVGYDGESGWWISRAFGETPHYALPPEFYRAYAETETNAPLLQALRRASNVSCARSCCEAPGARGARGTRCAAMNCEGADVTWCPGRSSEVLPAILALTPPSDAGLNEELAVSNGFRFGLRFLGQEEYMKKALEALRSSWPQIVQISRPSPLFSRLRQAKVEVLRLMLPRENCGEHRLDGLGNWSCDVPTQQLRKIMSRENDVVASTFFSHFQLPGSTMEQLLASLPGTEAQQVLRTACDWIRDNEAVWTAWAKPRAVPFYADTLHELYPFPLLLIVLLVAAAWMVSLENCWLWTTLSVREWRRILAKNGAVWRSDVELKLRKSLPDSPSSSPKRNPSGLQHAFWEGLEEKSRRRQSFWDQAERLLRLAELPEEKPRSCLVRFRHHTFPCFQRSKEAVLFLHRTACTSELHLEVVVEENSGAAKSGRDFSAGTYQVTFVKGQDEVALRIPIVYHQDCWQNSYWFQARILHLDGEGELAAPARANVLVLDEDTWPNNIPSCLRTGKGISLMRYFIQADRLRRGRKWTKTMIAMVFLPVHSVLVSTLVQKILVDHAVGRMMSSDPAWGYTECLILVLVQLLSLGLNRWADVVQTRNRGRTGGIRQVHRSEMIRKFMHLERSEYWEASETDWLYSAIYDVDVITNKAYFGVFVFFQSLFALLLSVLLVVGLAAWSYATEAASVSVQTTWYVLGVFVMMAAGVVGVWIRMKIIWVAVLARKKRECAWFKSCIFVFTSWRQFVGLQQEEKAKLEEGVLAQNDVFVPKHWDARDTMNDTAWITHWIQGISYILMLSFGAFALADYETYGVGIMEVGTFYALCKIYLSVGKYIGRLSKVFVEMQQAVVSLRDVAAMLNQTCQKSQRAEAARLQKLSRWQNEPGMVPGHICFQDDLCFVRPDYYKMGSTFSELRLRKGCLLPLGCTVSVSARNERVLRSFLGLASQVIHPTGSDGEDLTEFCPAVRVPPGLTCKMLSGVPVAFANGATTLQQLSFTGAPPKLCEKFVEAVGLEKDRDATSLGPGSSQVFSLIRALLCDADILCAFRPLSTVPLDVKPKLRTLLRLWQRGGLPSIAELLEEPMVCDVDRPRSRTLILGNEEISADVSLDLDELLWSDVSDSPQRRRSKTRNSTRPKEPPCSCFGLAYGRLP